MDTVCKQPFSSFHLEVHWESLHGVSQLKEIKHYNSVWLIGAIIQSSFVAWKLCFPLGACRFDIFTMFLYLFVTLVSLHDTPVITIGNIDTASQYYWWQLMVCCIKGLPMLLRNIVKTMSLPLLSSTPNHQSKNPLKNTRKIRQSSMYKCNR